MRIRSSLRFQLVLTSVFIQMEALENIRGSLTKDANEMFGMEKREVP